jgi:glycosyltransferase involved in cell wall biosynthesis
MRILFISSMAGHAWGGSEILWSSTACRLFESGHSVFASVTKWPERPTQIQKIADKGIDIQEHYWQPAPLTERILARISKRFPRRSGLDSAWQRIMEFNPNLVCVSHGATMCGVDWMLKCLKSSIPYVSIAQANLEQSWPSDQSLKEVRQAYSGAEKTFFVSRGNLELFQRQIGTRLTNCEVVFNPFNVKWHARPEWPEVDDSFCLACIARLEPSAKGQDILFQLLAMPKWRERNLKVSLYGKGPCEEGLRSLASYEGVMDRVIFRGHFNEIEIIWRTHHALILPSRYEGLPLSLVEAMLCGRPAIVTDVAGNAEIVQDNVTGFIAEAPTVRHLDEAMERAWLRRNEWKCIGAAAADAIRKIIPEDPAKVFSDKLISLCK